MFKVHTNQLEKKLKEISGSLIQILLDSKSGKIKNKDSTIVIQILDYNKLRS